MLGAFFFCLFIYWLPYIFVAVCGLSPVVASMGCSLVAVHRLLIAMASLVVKRGLQTCRLSSCGSQA